MISNNTNVQSNDNLQPQSSFSTPLLTSSRSPLSRNSTGLAISTLKLQWARFYSSPNIHCKSNVCQEMINFPGWMQIPQHPMNQAHFIYVYNDMGEGIQLFESILPSKGIIPLEQFFISLNHILLRHALQFSFLFS